MVLMEAGLIQVTPDPVKIGPNSIDLRLGDTLKTYHPTEGRVTVRDPVGGAEYATIDPKNPPPLIDVPKVNETFGTYPPRAGTMMGMVPWDEDKYKDCWLLVPGQFYLASTMEETFCKGVVPHLDGRSTCGRLSISAHKTAGVGDNGFRGKWTLEIEATKPVLVRPGDRLFQMYFTPAWGSGLAYFIRALHNGTPAWLNRDDPMWVDAGEILPDGGPRDFGPLFELSDLYGEKGEGHHYFGSGGVRGPEPLD